MLFNLANQYANNDMYPEALNTYQVIVKNKMFTNAGEGQSRHNKAKGPLLSVVTHSLGSRGHQ